MTERDPLTIVAEELPKLAAAVKKLEHPILKLLLDQAEAELAARAGTRRNLADCGARRDESQPSQESGAAG